MRMTELMRLIQTHLDKYGVSRAEFARRAGTTPQTVQNWRDEIKAMPEVKHLRGVAEVTGQPYVTVLDAALVDAGYRDSMVDSGADLDVRIRRAAGADPGILDELWLTVNMLKAERAAASGAAVSDQAEVRSAADLIARMLRGFDRDDRNNSG